jgi:catalase
METNSIQALTEIVRHTPLATVLFGDRGIPRTWRHMNGYGSHSWINADGQISWVKYHFISDQGIECLTQEEADRSISVDGDYHTRDLHEAIKRGEDPSWTPKMQIMSFDDAKNYRINPFDLTKTWPHADYPLIEVGKLVLDRNYTDHHTQIEQAAFSPSNQAAAAASIRPDPGPAYIRPELISGGNIAKSIAAQPPS